MGARERVTKFASVNVDAAARAIAEVGGIGRRQEPALSPDVCRNCGDDGASERAIVPECDHEWNAIALCPDCAADRTEGGSRADCGGLPVDRDRVIDRDDGRCRGCGVREALVVGDVLHLHAVVPVATGGHRHVHNVVALCPICHERVHDRG
ncbi:HNH endonuclease [Haloarchaeobius salinus]|uniref:HNH endonuclease n=1 Tax=Haloarchaeobius salinus TaxID=1198298 RepID=UPI00210DD184|nr:HNH endonuclease [Haloarchaeobius salinus]